MPFESNQSGQNPLTIQEINEVTQDFRVFQARNASQYVALMADIVKTLNNCPMGQMKGLDVEELRNQSGHLLYYKMKGADADVPCDIEYVPNLFSHLRKPSYLVLKRVQKYLMASHRRILARLERENSLEKMAEDQAFDIGLKIKGASKEINRYLEMARMVKGGGRKLDILMQAMQVQSRIRFELLYINRIIKDPNDPRYGSLQDWLKKSKFRGNHIAFTGLINNGFQILDSSATKLAQLMESLAGFKLDPDTSAVDLDKSWYTLGKSLPRGDDFVNRFTAEEKVEERIKRLTMPMVQVSWDADRLRNSMNEVMVNAKDPKEQGEKLSNLFFELEKKIVQSTKPDGLVQTAITSDLQVGMISKSEGEKARQWVKENKLKLQQVMLDTYNSLQELKENNPGLPLPEHLEDTLNRIQDWLKGDRDEQLRSVESDLGSLTIEDLKAKVESFRQEIDKPSGNLLVDLCKTRDHIIERINEISINNISFHKKVREAYQDFNEYENQVLKLYKFEEDLDFLRVTVDGWIYDVYREVNYDGLPEKTLTACLSVIIQRMLTGLQKINYDVIDADKLKVFYQRAVDNTSDDECVLRLDQLLQELRVIPGADLLIAALNDWEDDLGRDKVKAKQKFILTNEEKLRRLAEMARAELRERMPNSKVQSRRLRFEVFGLSDCLASSLRSLLEGLLEMAPRVASAPEGERLISSIQSLESQVIEAQKTTQAGGEGYQKLAEMARSKKIDGSLAKILEKDLQLNFKDLDGLLEDTNEGLKRVRLLQNRFGANKDTDYLDVTINYNDLEKLKSVYDFLDTVTMEDIKRFCVAYNLKTGLLNDYMDRAFKKDLSIPKEISSQVKGKVYKLYMEKRHIAAALKWAVLNSSQDIFDAECQLLCHALNMVTPTKVRGKGTYLGFVRLFQLIENADAKVNKQIGLAWGRTQTRLFNFKPKNHKANYEGNRQAFMTDVKAVVDSHLRR